MTSSSLTAWLPTSFTNRTTRASLIKFCLIGIPLMMGLSGCLPTDQTTTAATVASTFGGITSAQTLGDTKIKVTWDPSTLSTTKFYNIYDASTSVLTPTLMKTVSSTQTSVTLTSLTPGRLYLLRVRAADATNAEDNNTNDLQAIPYAGVTISATNVISSTSVQLTYASVSNGDGVDIWCNTPLNPVDQILASNNDTTQTTVTLTGLSAGTLYTCRAAMRVGNFDDNNTVTTTFTPIGTAASLAFSTQPGSVIAGGSFSPQPVVKIYDANGTLVSAGPDSTATISLLQSGGSLSGVITAVAVGGVANFSGMTETQSGTFTISATKSDTSTQAHGSGPISATSASFIVSPATVDPLQSSIKIYVSGGSGTLVVPTSAIVADGQQTYTVVVSLKDHYGNLVPDIRPTFASTDSSTTDTLTQATVTTQTSPGVWQGSFSSTLADTARKLSISSPSGLTSDFITAPTQAGAVSQLAFTTQPKDAGAQGAMAPVAVAAEDQFGNVILTGLGSAYSIDLAIYSDTDGAVLSGTHPVTASSGVATFPGLSIDKIGSGRKLIATSNTLQVLSDSFNITAASPYKVVITGPTSVMSSKCSGAISVALQDAGSNASSPSASTPIFLSGWGSGAFYSSSDCSGTAIAPTSSGSTNVKLSFTSSTPKIVYFKDLHGEALTIAATDPSGVLVGSSIPVKVTPDKVALTLASTNVVAAKCSAALTITPQGDDGNAAPTFTATPVSLTGLGSVAALYSDSACGTSIPVTGGNATVTLPVSSGTNYTTNVYVKDAKAETLTMNVADPATNGLTTNSANQALNVLASNITFTGPNSVVSGKCSAVFTISLVDAQVSPAAVNAPANTTLTINGLSGSSTAAFYTTSACTGTAYTTSLTVPSGSSTIQLYFKDTKAETFSLYLSDPNLQLANSPTIALGISPSAFGITGSMPTAATTVCAGPYLLKTLDGTGTTTAAITPITANLSGAGTAGSFYSNSTCSTPITTLSYATGDSQKSFYVMSQYPASLTLTAADNASVLTSATYALAITAAPGFIGTQATTTDTSGNPIWFTTGYNPVSARQDGSTAPIYVHVDSGRTALYVTDGNQHKILKYNYTTKQYVGWLGYYSTGNSYLIAGDTISGSNLTTPSSASCINTTNGKVTPGWCVGGQATYSSNNTGGALRDPRGIADDGTSIYVVNNGGFNISRYDAASGAFTGWIGRVYSTPTSSNCSSTTQGQLTPGWCVGGQNYDRDIGISTTDMGNGQLYYPHAVTYYNYNLYVASQGAIHIYNASTGVWGGWIGWNGTGSSGAVTPGWTTGGTPYQTNPNSKLGAVNNPSSMVVVGGTLYVLYTDNGGTIQKWNATTGAYLGLLSTNGTWVSPQAMATDGTYLYVADWSRVIRVDSTGLIQGWIGKVNNAPTADGTGGPGGCSALTANATTPGWCLGGSSKHGMEERAFNEVVALDYDGTNLITGGGGWSVTNTGTSGYFPAIRAWNATTGTYAGTLATKVSASPSAWSNSLTAAASQYGFDDNSMFSPAGSYNDGTYLYVTEFGNSRVKKINLKTGATVGWVGGIATSPTGGTYTVSGTTYSCAGYTPMGGSPGWCLGALPSPQYMWNNLVSVAANGVMYQPMAITGDGTYLYVADYGYNRIQKFLAADGTYIGWIGRISSQPTGGATGCTNAAYANLFTPGWCTGGTSQGGTGDGQFNNPTGIVYYNNSIYVVDSNNHRVMAFDTATGAFKGWIGRVQTAPNTGTGACTTAANGSGYTVSTNGWCTGGTSQAAGNDKGGGFYFAGRSSITVGTDSSTGTTYLYIANTYNRRIDRWTLGGVFMGGANPRTDTYTTTWSSDPTTLYNWTNQSSYYAFGLWTDNTNMYANVQVNNYTNATAVMKMGLVSGTVIGWKGQIVSGVSPTNGPAGSGCSGATGITPDWCQGGATNFGITLGGYWSGNYITGDNYYLYISDESTHRVTRITK